MKIRIKNNDEPQKPMTYKIRLKNDKPKKRTETLRIKVIEV